MANTPQLGSATVPGKQAIENFLQKLGIADHPGLRVKLKQEGYKNFTFGCATGPSGPNVTDLSHELAHACQFGARYFAYRALPAGFRFKLREIFVYDRYCIEPKTAQATCRELDTFAYQLHLLELAGEVVDHAEYFVYAAGLMTQFMHDWWHIPGKGESERKAWCVKRAKSCYAKHKPATVKRRLIAWLNATQNHLEFKND